MKSRFFIILLLTILFVPILSSCGLRTIDDRLDAVEDAVEHRLDTVEDIVERPLDMTENALENTLESQAPLRNNAETAPVSTPSVNNVENISKEEAETIALEHAGLTADKVTRLHTEYEIDDRVPMYEVQFYYDHWEYDYDIHAETGEILSFDKDD